MEPNLKLFSKRKEEPTHVKSSQVAQLMELGELMWARKEEAKAGAATAWNQKSNLKLVSYETSTEIYILLVVYVLKK